MIFHTNDISGVTNCMEWVFCNKQGKKAPKRYNVTILTIFIPKLTIYQYFSSLSYGPPSLGLY